MTRRLKLTIAYDGTSYAGWQRQKNAATVQQTVEEAVLSLFHEEVHLMGAGRTDAGVHAEGQVAAMDLTYEIAPDRLRLALNSELPADIRIMRIEEAASDFHPRFMAKRKTYRYSFYVGETLPPRYRFTVFHERRKQEIDRIREVLPLFMGRHDFAAFHSTGSIAEAHGSTTVRTIYDIRLVQDPSDPGLYHLFVTGDGFLYNMVRIIVGTLLEIGCGKRSGEDVQNAFRSGERTLAGPTAPAKGLCLVSIDYPACDKTSENPEKY